MWLLPRKRLAFTLIELLVVIAVIALLIGLLLPAVQKVREAAARTQCQNNLKQITLGTLNFADCYEAFPPARIAQRPNGLEPFWRGCGGQEPTWFVRILPFIEEQNIFQKWDLTQPYNASTNEVRQKVVKTYLCPARRSSGQAITPNTIGPPIVLPCGCSFPGRPVQGGATGDYAGNMGDLSPGTNGQPTDFYWGGNGTGVIISSRAICERTLPVNWYDRIRILDIQDGTSNTFLAGEMHIPRGKLASVPDNGPLYDGTNFFNSCRVGGPGVPIAQGPDDTVFGLSLYAFGSWHSDICHFSFVDGRVSAVRNSISTQVLERLCNRYDGQVIPEF